jgi:hypothetical protein
MHLVLLLESAHCASAGGQENQHGVVLVDPTKYADAVYTKQIVSI